MKKFIVALGVAAMALGVTGCGNSGSSSTSGDASADSIAILMGDIQGANYLQMWNQLPDTMKARLNKDKVLAGMKSIMERDFKGDQDYIMGVQIAMQLVGNVATMEDAGVGFNHSAFISHFCEAFSRDSVNRAEVDAKTAQIRKFMDVAQDKMMQKQTADRERMMKEAQEAAEPNIKAGKEYVEKQKKADPEIKTLESGVSYKVVKEGSGAKPTKNDMVQVNYVGKHIDGTEFDSSNGTPRTFGVQGVVPGFSEILQMMAPGAKYVAYIPADQAYGVQGSRDIKPGETLVFEIELVSVGAPKAEAAQK
ncbi:MAG: FKBP-type peptidyl-prolyl cis-trans isomerase [Firmicutes bacterium]|nr:FKBP-type peptidyl-prolyl cis-trans isomerase [Bacillota bacterium]MCM1400593.1 FKBP-type peptidyl-prolyl cis-trans isomerase [Bacteroides sp.]MCM1477480.1 FKBP-type peptidyl-prolyl cis-trans isomerase [Bacteroides sp.]